VTVARRPTAVAAVLVVAVLGLSACDPKEAGSAAVVGGTRITETQLDTNAREVTDRLHAIGATIPDADALLRAQLEVLVDTTLVDEAARREGITVTQGEIDQLVEQAGGRSTVEKQLLTQQNLWLPPGSVDDLARSVLIQRQLGQRLAPTGDATAQSDAVTKYMSDLANELGVDVSPRYGAWDNSQLHIGAPPNDLSRPASATS
jgi:hypothetical protein